MWIRYVLVGVIAVLLGLLVGLLIPRTQPAVQPAIAVLQPVGEEAATRWVVTMDSDKREVILLKVLGGKIEISDKTSL